MYQTPFGTFNEPRSLRDGVPPYYLYIPVPHDPLSGPPCDPTPDPTSEWINALVGSYGGLEMYQRWGGTPSGGLLGSLNVPNGVWYIRYPPIWYIIKGEVMLGPTLGHLPPSNGLAPRNGGVSS